MTVEPEGPRAQQRFAWLDLLRLACAVAVVLFHYAFVAPVVDRTVPASYAFMPDLTVYGRLGVQVFFVISGFVIAMSSEGRSWSEFLWARFLRLYPAYWLAVIATALVLWGTAAPHAPGFGQTLVNLTMFQSFLGVENVDGVYHTLALEMRFYLMVAALMVFRIRVTSLAVMGAWFGLCLASMIAPPALGKLVMATWAPYFLAGMLIRSLLVPGQRPMKWLLFAGALALEGYATRLPDNPRLGAYHPEIVFMLAVIGTLLVLACAFAPNPRGGHAIRTLAVIGGMTYPLYLFHSEIGMALMHRLAPSVPAWLSFWPMVVAMLLVARVVSRLPEPMLRRWLRRLGEQTGQPLARLRPLRSRT